MSRIVVKIGTSVLTKDDGFLDVQRISDICDDISNLHHKGHQIIIVTSGAIGTGIGKLKLGSGPESIIEKQALAAVGQPFLMSIYQDSFSKYGILISQILLTREDLENRIRYLRIRDTILTLLSEYKTLPIINENDTVSVEEIRFGDNDMLSALVAVKMGADYLIILTNVDGLYNPKRGEIIKVVKKITPEMIEMTKGMKTSKFSSGGMYTKLQAAKISTSAGIEVHIANGNVKNVVSRIIGGENVGTKFLPELERITAKKKWILFVKRAKGKIVIDDGAVDAIKNKSKSLLPIGIISVEGKFSIGDVVKVCDKDDNEIARGLVYYSSENINNMKGKSTQEIRKIFPDAVYEEIIHKDNLVVIE